MSLMEYGEKGPHVASGSTPNNPKKERPREVDLLLEPESKEIPVRRTLASLCRRYCIDSNSCMGCANCFVRPLLMGTVYCRVGVHVYNKQKISQVRGPALKRALINIPVVLCDTCSMALVIILGATLI